MTKAFYSSPRARFLDSNGNPLSNGRVSFYEPNTTTLKTIYSDVTENTPAPNPMLLDADGYVQDGGVWLGEGRYKFKLDQAIVPSPDVNEDADFQELWTIDNILGDGVTDGGELSTIFVDSVADMIQLNTSSYSLVYCGGYYQNGDGGGGFFYYDAGNGEIADDGVIFSPVGAPALGRYVRILESGEITNKQYGAFELNPSSNEGKISSGLSYALTNGYRFHFVPSRVDITIDTVFPFKANVVFDAGFSFYQDPLEAEKKYTFLAKTFTFNGRSPIISGSANVALISDDKSDVYPELWGAVSGQDCYNAFIKMQGNYNSSLVIDQTYDITASGVPSPTLIGLDALHFTQFGSLTSAIQVALNSYTWDKQRSQFFDIPFDKLNYNAGFRQFYASHFGTDYSDYSDMVTAVTNSGSNDMAVIWDNRFNTIFSLSDDGAGLGYERITSIVEDGATLNLNTIVDMGYLSAGNYQVFEPNVPNGYLKVSTQKINPFWFGAKNFGADTPSNAITNTLALIRCFNTNWRGVSGVIDGGGADFAISNEIIVNKNIKLKNIELYATTSTTFTGSNVLTCTNGGDLENVTINQNSATISNSINLTNGSYKIKSCNFKAPNGALINTNDLEIKDSVIESSGSSVQDFTITCDNLDMQNNTIIRMTTSITKTVDCCGLVKNNTFKNGRFVVYNPSYYKIKDNSFVQEVYVVGDLSLPQIILDGVSPNYNVIDLDITGNSHKVSASQTGSHLNVFVGSNIDVNGHRGIEVSNNEISPLGSAMTPSGTRVSAQWNISTSGNQVVSSGFEFILGQSSIVSGSQIANAGGFITGISAIATPTFPLDKKVSFNGFITNSTFNIYVETSNNNSAILCYTLFVNNRER